MAPVFFWRETEQPYGVLCQWFSSPFQDESGITYLTAEHYMMYHTAQCYSSTSIAAEVLAAKNPRKTKSLGRKVDMASDQGKRWEQEKGFPAQFAEENRHAWGMNMLGKALMSVREQLKQGQAPE